ncbi:acyltransferase [Halalkalicoccus jeotgali]|uniref:Acetyltransferase n=1 Tax=Halalkalicoccus jeotgali (strain DSM 18796 / CECT 7217 / JCM 14584 / KCTC 4019 / B3) TaxID=795797 RepID=D8J5R8_HALJB|nr:N-acetyltransferase [Halalkalicoccus jeotgali]ADJ13724.1 Acetyltransferase [Halalkalicoccus jeotgali B3]ELY34229.1 acetyltransferase [Halalkalicoccus jeotgali B3]
MTETRVELGEDCVIDDPDSVGYLHDESADPAVIGDRARIRKGTIVYADTEIGDDFITGHNALVREKTTIGDGVIVGTDTVIDGTTEIGSHVSLQTGVYVPTDTTIGSNVFVGPRAVMTNDPYPVRREVDLVGPTLEDGVSVGANATILPGVRIGAGSFVAAGATVTEDVPPHTLALGTPARNRDLPESLSGENLLNE